MTTPLYNEKLFAVAKEKLKALPLLFDKLDKSTKTDVFDLCRLVLCSDGRGVSERRREHLCETFPQMILSNISLVNAIKKEAASKGKEGEKGASKSGSNSKSKEDAKKKIDPDLMMPKMIKHLRSRILEIMKEEDRAKRGELYEDIYVPWDYLFAIDYLTQNVIDVTKVIHEVRKSYLSKHFESSLRPRDLLERTTFADYLGKKLKEDMGPLLSQVEWTEETRAAVETRYKTAPLAD